MSIPCHCRAIKCQCYSKSLFLCHDCREEEVSVGKVRSTPKCIRAPRRAETGDIIVFPLFQNVYFHLNYLPNR